jgi:hypothetical protein
MLTPNQLAALRAAINAETDPAFVEYRTNGQTPLMRDFFNQPTAAPAFTVWRTNVSRADIYNRTSAEGTNWSWTFYKNQSQVEQNAWVQMFMGDQADFSQANLRAGIAVIFTAASSANAAHALAIGKRAATRGEKLFATGPGLGTVVSPAQLVFEGAITDADISAALAL